MPATQKSPSQAQAWLSLSLLLGINLFNYIDRYVLAAVEPKIQATLFPGRPENDPYALTRMGALATAFIISYMVAAPLLGWLADHVSRWLIVGCSVILWSLATGASGLASVFIVLILIRSLVGVGEAGYGPAAPTIISDLFSIKRRGLVLAIFYMAIPVGSAIGYTVGGRIEERFGWRMAFFAVTPPGLLLGFLCFLFKDPPRGAADHAHAGPPRLRDYLELFTIPSYVLDTAGMAAMTFAIGGISYWMPRYIANVRLAGSLAHVDFIFGALTVIAGISATILGGLAGDLLRKKFPGSYFLVSGTGILLACPFILLMLHDPFPLAWTWIFLAEFWLFFNTGPSNTILANVTQPSVRATAFAFNILLIHALGDAPSPPILGHIAGIYGWNTAFSVVTAVTAAGGIFWILGARFLAADTAAVAPLQPVTPARGFEVIPLDP